MGLQSGEVRATRQGVLWIDYDLRPIAVETWQQRHTQAVVLAMAVLLVRWACWPWRTGAFCGPWPRCVQAWNALAQAISPTCHACRAVAISTTWGRHRRNGERTAGTQHGAGRKRGPLPATVRRLL